MVDLITSDRCNAAGTATYKAPDQQVDITYTASFDTPGDADLTNEFCEVTCLIELCDTLVEGANCDNTVSSSRGCIYFTEPCTYVGS